MAQSVLAKILVQCGCLSLNFSWKTPVRLLTIPGKVRLQLCSFSNILWKKKRGRKIIKYHFHWHFVLLSCLFFFLCVYTGQTSAKKADAQKGWWQTTSPSGNRICTNGTTHKHIPTTSLLTFKATDPITHQVRFQYSIWNCTCYPASIFYFYILTWKRILP